MCITGLNLTNNQFAHIKHDTMVCYYKANVNSFPLICIKSCFYCDKLGHVAHLDYIEKNREQEIAKNVNDDDDYTFVVGNGYIPGACASELWIREPPNT